MPFSGVSKAGLVWALQRRTLTCLHEEDKYLKTRQRSADAGFRVIVYGHTHLPKRKPLVAADGQPAIYLNTGTWADVMCIPSGIWDDDTSAGRDVFRRFAGDLVNPPSVGGGGRSPPMLALRLRMPKLSMPHLLFADDHSAVTTDGLLKRLAAEAAA